MKYERSKRRVRKLQPLRTAEQAAVQPISNKMRIEIIQKINVAILNGTCKIFSVPSNSKENPSR